MVEISDTIWNKGKEIYSYVTSNQESVAEGEGNQENVSESEGNNDNTDQTPTDTSSKFTSLDELLKKDVKYFDKKNGKIYYKPDFFSSDTEKLVPPDLINKLRNKKNDDKFRNHYETIIEQLDQNSDSNSDLMGQFQKLSKEGYAAKQIFDSLMNNKTAGLLISVNSEVGKKMLTDIFGKWAGSDFTTTSISMALVAARILGNPVVTYAFTQLGNILWKYRTNSMLNTTYRGTGVYGALVAPLTLEEEEAWSDIKWSQTVHQFTYALNKSITNVTNAVIKENEMKGVEVTKTNFQPFKLKKKQKKSLVFRIATNTLDRDVTYAEWEYLSKFLKFQTNYSDYITGKKNERKQFIEKNDYYKRATLKYSDTPNSKRLGNIKQKGGTKTLGQTRLLRSILV